MTLGEWIVTGIVFTGLLLPAGLIKLSLMLSDFRVEQVKSDMKKNDFTQEETQLLDLLIEEYENKRKT